MTAEKDEPELSPSGSLAVFLFAISKHWRKVRISDGTRVPNHLFASSMAPAFLLEGGPSTTLRNNWHLPQGDILLDPTTDTIDDVIAFLGLSAEDIAFLAQYYRLEGGSRFFSLLSDRRKFTALYKRTPQFTADLRDLAALAKPAAADAKYADPEKLEELLYLDPGTLVPLNASYEFVLGNGCREEGRKALNNIELTGGIRVRENGVHVAIGEFLPFIREKHDNPQPDGLKSWLSWLKRAARP